MTQIVTIIMGRGVVAVIMVCVGTVGKVAVIATGEGLQ